MIKVLTLISLLIGTGFSKSFDTFMKEALKNSPYLHASVLEIDQAKNEGDLQLRYKNPNVAVESSSFETNSGTSESGYRVSLTQPLRLWGLSGDKSRYAKALVKSAQVKNRLNKAQFIRDISLSYLQYIKSKKFLRLGLEEITLAKKIYDISNARYKEGTISRGKVLQAKIDYDVAQSSYNNLSLVEYERYSFLLKTAVIDEETVLDDEHQFKLKIKKTEVLSPEQMFLQAQSDKASALARVNENSIEWVNLFGEYESEPEQNIMRVGLSFPLAIFNTKSQEQRIAKLESLKNKLLTDVTKTQDHIEQRRLTEESDRLKQLQKHSLEILKTELELLAMYEEGYKIANINLLELQNIKNKVIESKERLISIYTRLQSNIIYQNYLSGNYNE